MVVLWPPLTIVFVVCATQHFPNTARRPKPTLRRNRLLGRHIVVEDMSMMRNELLSNRTPAVLPHCPPGSEETSDGLHRANKRLRARLPSRECAASPHTAGLPSTLEAATAFDVGFWVEIAAEWRKVFSAVSIPEYIETWMEFPDESGTDYWVHLGPDDMLCINRTRTAAAVRIFRLRIQIKRKSLTFLWENIEPNSMHASKVEIVMTGGPHRCCLRLRHSGLRNWDERQLYSRIWSRSLDKLQGLLQCPADSLRVRGRVDDDTAEG